MQKLRKQEPMTIKDKMINAISSLDDDASIDQGIYQLQLLRKIEIGLQQIADGEFIEHNEFMDQLENEETR